MPAQIEGQLSVGIGNSLKEVITSMDTLVPSEMFPGLRHSLIH